MILSLQVWAAVEPSNGFLNRTAAVRVRESSSVTAARGGRAAGSGD
jgi:hypothetical protein